MQAVRERPTAQTATEEKLYTPPKPKPVYDFCKRAFDLVFAALALVILSPVFLVVILAIWISDGGPAFFVQERLTKGGKRFRMYKFRTMCPDAEEKLPELMAQNEMTGPAFKLTDDPRVTKVGKILRHTSIDELPQLINIIKGDMSIVGPRPPLPGEVAQYNEYQMHRLDVKTGLACFHECQGRSHSRDFDKWVESDLEYIQTRGIWTDIKIILLTVKTVITGKGAM